jgi:hypothetical protein
MDVEGSQQGQKLSEAAVPVSALLSFLNYSYLRAMRRRAEAEAKASWVDEGTDLSHTDPYWEGKSDACQDEVLTLLELQNLISDYEE